MNPMKKEIQRSSCMIMKGQYLWWEFIGGKKDCSLYKSRSRGMKAPPATVHRTAPVCLLSGGEAVQCSKLVLVHCIS